MSRRRPGGSGRAVRWGDVDRALRRAQAAGVAVSPRAWRCAYVILRSEARSGGHRAGQRHLAKSLGLAQPIRDPRTGRQRNQRQVSRLTAELRTALVAVGGELETTPPEHRYDREAGGWRSVGLNTFRMILPSGKSPGQTDVSWMTRRPPSTGGPGGEPPSGGTRKRSFDAADDRGDPPPAPEPASEAAKRAARAELEAALRRIKAHRARSRRP